MVYFYLEIIILIGYFVKHQFRKMIESELKWHQENPDQSKLELKSKHNWVGQRPEISKDEQSKSIFISVIEITEEKALKLLKSHNSVQKSKSIGRRQIKAEIGWVQDSEGIAQSTVSNQNKCGGSITPKVL